MLRNNDATELCITKGQEGICVGWDAIEGSHGKPVLQTLYVKLVDPPKSVQFEGLPLNVVPIPRTTSDVTCRLPNDTEISIQREQVVILPNFAMTDYSSQGKTRPINVVDPGRCKNHQSYYTALSRSASAAGTVLVQPFSDKKITCGISGHLRQEFRELEMLNTITKKAYEGCLPESVKGRLRNVIIYAYQKSSVYKKERDSYWHSEIQWKSEENEQKTENRDGFWLEELNSKLATSKIEKKTNNSKKHVPQSIDSQTIVTGASEKTKGKKAVTAGSSNEAAENNGATDQPHAKKSKNSVDSTNEREPLGLKWDGHNYSCGYDSFFTIMYNIWSDNTCRFSDELSRCSSWMNVLCEQFSKMVRGATFESARDNVRMLLHRANSQAFPMGKQGLLITSLIHKFVGQTAFGRIVNTCTLCGSVCSNALVGCHVLTLDDTDMDVASLMGANESQTYVKKRCVRCSGLVYRKAYLDEIPSLIAVETTVATPSVQLCLCHGSETVVYTLRGLIYWGQFHFVSRVVDKNGQVWFHDGMSTGSGCQWERTIGLSSDTRWLKKAGSKNLCICIYIRSDE